MARMLVADDDAVSRQFFAETAAECGWCVTTVADGLAALDAATREPFDLLVLDLAMPGLDGEGVWHRLRDHPNAASHTAAAIATSAELSPSRSAALRAAGFAHAIAKPLALAELRQLLRRYRPAAVLDDEAALQALGTMSTVHALRRLFGIELNALPAELERLREEPVALRERLHRLSASCGFCGAAALDAAGVVLRDHLDATGEVDPSHFASLRALAVATRDELAAYDSALLDSGEGAEA